MRVEDGLIVGIEDGIPDVDVGDLVVLPGLVDSHVHVNEPGRTHWEGFATATRAAAAGGTTTIVDMPLNSIPPTVDRSALDTKRHAAKGKVAVDVAFWGGIVPGSFGSVPELVAEGVCGFKVFLVDSGVPEFPPVTLPAVADVMAEVGGIPLLVHAEDHDSLANPAGDPRAYGTYLASRPGGAEAVAIDSLEPLSGRGPVHVLHVSGGEALSAIRKQDLSAETCPHYLTFIADDIPDGATAFKCAPPIRTEEDREALWDGLRDGTLGMVVSDHSPAPPDVKDLDGGNFIEAWGGIASVELRLVAVWDGAVRRGFGPGDVSGWLAEAPAALAGLDGRKGTIEVGKDADLVVFDPDGVTTVDARRLHQRHPVTPYDGMSLRGEVIATYLRGTPVFGPGSDPDGFGGELLKRGA